MDDRLSLYSFNLFFRAFVTADVDFDGKVSVEEFDGMIEADEEYFKVELPFTSLFYY